MRKETVEPLSSDTDAIVLEASRDARAATNRDLCSIPQSLIPRSLVALDEIIAAWEAGGRLVSPRRSAPDLTRCWHCQRPLDLVEELERTRAELERARELLESCRELSRQRAEALQHQREATQRILDRLGVTGGDAIGEGGAPRFREAVEGAAGLDGRDVDPDQAGAPPDPHRWARERLEARRPDTSLRSEDAS